MKMFSDLSRIILPRKVTLSLNSDLITPRPFPWPWALSTWVSGPCPATSRASFCYFTSDGTPNSRPEAAAAVGKGWRAKMTKPSWIQSWMGTRTQTRICRSYLPLPHPCLFHVTSPQSIKAFIFTRLRQSRKDKSTCTVLKVHFLGSFLLTIRNGLATRCTLTHSSKT